MISVSPPPFNGGVITNNLEIKGNLLLRDPVDPSRGGMFEPSPLADGFVYLKHLDDSDRGELLAREMPLITIQSGTISSHTGDLLETTLVDLPIFGGFMGANGVARAIIAGVGKGNNANKTVTVYFGGTLILTFTVNASPSDNPFYLDICIHNVNNEAVQQISLKKYIAGVSPSLKAGFDTAIDTTSNKNLTVKVDLGNAADSLQVDTRLVWVSYHN